MFVCLFVTNKQIKKAEPIFCGSQDRFREDQNWKNIPGK